MRIIAHLKFLVVGVILGVFGVWYLYTSYFAFSMPTLDDLFRENIEYKFYSYATQITGKQRLQVAKLNQIEVFERTSRASALWVELPSVVVKATVPVEYSFYVDMSRGWKFQRHQNEIFVEVPALSNSTPAADVSKLHYDVIKGSLLRSENDSLEKIRKDLMGLLIEKSIEHRAEVRDQARLSIEQFVRGWLAQTTGEIPPEKIHVKFLDEAIQPPQMQ